MSLIGVDLLGFVADIKRDTKLFQWLSLIFQMTLSSVVTFLFTCGSALVAHVSTPVAIGSGMVAVAVTLCIFFGSSELTRGMMLVRPEKEVEEQLKSDIAITRKS